MKIRLEGYSTSSSTVHLYGLLIFQTRPLRTHLICERNIIIMTDKSRRANLIHFLTYRSKPLVRPVLGCEIHALVNAFDVAFTLKNDSETITKTSLPLTMLTDSLNFKVLLNSSTMFEKGS